MSYSVKLSLRELVVVFAALDTALERNEPLEGCDLWDEEEHKPVHPFEVSDVRMIVGQSLARAIKREKVRT